MIFKKIKIRRLRKVMRGHIFLFKDNNLKISNDIKRDISATLLFKNDKFISNFFFGSPNIDLNNIGIQFLKLNLYNTRLNEAIQIYFADKKKISFPLSYKLFSIFEKKKIKLNKFLSFVKYIIFSFKYFLKGHLYFFKYISSSVINLKKQNINDYAYFSAIQDRVFKNKKVSTNSIVNWYMREPNLNKIKNIVHDCQTVNSFKHDNFNITFAEGPTPKINNLFEILRLLNWYILASSLCVLLLLFGNFTYMILFQESIKYKIFNVVDKKKIANYYFFNNSNAVYRPIWTYEAERRKSKIFFYFYSVNNEQIKTSLSHYKNLSFWQNLSWPNYLIWSKIQLDFINKISIVKHETYIIGPITDTGDNKVSINSQKKIISIFDIQPHRSSKYNTDLTDHIFFPPNSVNFIKDITSSCDLNNYICILKRKRDISNNLHPVYKHFINKLINKNILSSYDYDDDIKDILRKSDLVVCAPYTSVAHIAFQLGVKCIYYDASNTIDVSDKARHGIKMISGKNKLNEFIKKI